MLRVCRPGVADVEEKVCEFYVVTEENETSRSSGERVREKMP